IDPTAAGSGDHEIDQHGLVLVTGEDLELQLRDGVDPVLGAAVDLGVPALAAESGGLGDGEPGDAVPAQGVGHLLQGRRAASAPPGSYPASAWWLMSMPARSSASGILQPRVTASSTAIAMVSTPEITIAA